MRGTSGTHEDSANGVNTNSDTLATYARLIHYFAAFADQGPAKTAGQLIGCTVYEAGDLVSGMASAHQCICDFGHHKQDF